jgi:hypothetical protein
MSQIRYVGQPSDRVHRGASRTAMKKARWGHVPKQKQPTTWMDVKSYIEVAATTFGIIVAWFLAFLYAGL